MQRGLHEVEHSLPHDFSKDTFELNVSKQLCWEATSELAYEEVMNWNVYKVPDPVKSLPGPHLIPNACPVKPELSRLKLGWKFKNGVIGYLDKEQTKQESSMLFFSGHIKKPLVSIARASVAQLVGVWSHAP